MGAAENVATEGKIEAKQEQFDSFAQMDMQVGGRIQLVSFRGKKLTSYASVIGWEAHQYLLTTIPKDNGVNMPLNVGERVDVRFFSGISIYIFSSCVQFLYYNPRPFLELVFPSKILHVPLRKAMRIALTMPVTVTKNTAKQLAATAVDLSPTGMMLHSETPLGKVGDPLGLTFVVKNTISKEEAEIQATGIIRNIHAKDGAQPSIYVHGVSFEQLSQSSLTILQNFLYETIMGKRTA